MAYDIGPKIGMDGEAEFRKSLQNINQQLKTLGSEMKAVTSAFADGDKSEEALAAQTDVLNRQIDAQQKKLEELQKGLDASAQKYGENDTRTLKWAQSVNNAAADLNKLKSQLAQAERGMDDLGNATEDAGDAADNVGGKFGSFQVALGNLVASGIQAAISAVGNFVGALVNLDETTEEYRRAQGRLNTAFEAAGYGADTAQKAYQAFYGILGDTDTATEASQLLAQLADSEEDVAKWTEIAAGVSGTFGDSLPIEGLIEAANETAKVGEVTGTLADALNWVGISEDNFNTQLAACSTEAERNQLIMNTLAGQYDEASEAFYRNNEALVAARNAQAQMDASLATLGESISNIKTRLTTELTPALSGVIDAFNGGLNGESGSGADLSGAITELVNSVVAMLPDVLSAGAQVVGALVTGITQSIPSILAAGGELIGQLITGVSAALPELSNSAVNIMSSFGSYLSDNLPILIENGLQAVKKFTQSIRENAGLVVDGAIGLAKSFSQGLADSIPAIIENVPAIITSIAGVINDNAPKIFAAAVEIIGTLINGLIESIPTLIENIPQIIMAIVNAFLAFNWVNLGRQIIVGLHNGISAMITSIKNIAKQLADAIKNGINTLPQQLLQIGKNIVQGLWNGIKSMGAWIRDQISDFLAGIVSTVKGVLGIHSPSTVFAGMGKNMALGLGEGFGDEMRSVQRNINRSMAELSSPELNAAYNESTAVSGGGAAQYQDSAANVIAAAVQSALQGAAVYLNGRRVGSLITQQQNAAAVARGQSQVYL